MLGAGVLLILVGGVGATGLIGATPAATTSPPPVAAASPTPGSAATTAPATLAASLTPAATTDPHAAVRAFFADLVAAIRAGNVSVMGARLDRAVIDRYGVTACEAELAGRAPDPTYAVAITMIHDPAPWGYVTDGRSTTIPDTWTVDASVTAVGETAVRQLHVAGTAGTVTWFTDCGTPR